MKKEVAKMFTQKAFTVAELVVTMLVVAFLVFVLLGFMNRDQQKEFNAKLDKTEANIIALIDRAFVNETGRSAEYSVREIYDLANDRSGISLNVVDTCNTVSCWGDNDNTGVDLSNAPKYKLNDGTSVAFYIPDEGTGRIYIDANGAKIPNKLGKDIRELKVPQLSRTTATPAVCPAPKIARNNTCCMPKGANDVWTAETGCNRCTRDNTKLIIDQIWGAENTAQACNPTCPKDKNVNRTTACCAKLGTNEVWTASAGCGKCTRTGSLRPGEEWGKDGTADACIKGCPSNTVDRTTACCTDIGKNDRWINKDGCDICSITKDEVWTGKVGCNKCNKNNFRNNTCCKTANNSNPKNSTMNKTGCDYTCKTGSDNSTYLAANHNNANITVSSPSKDNKCKYGYTCKGADKIITNTTLIDRLNYCFGKNGNDSSMCGPHAYQDGSNASLTNYGELYYFELNNGRKDFFVHTVHDGVNWYRSYTNTSNGTSVSAFNSLQNVSSYVNSNNTYKVKAIITTTDSKGKNKSVSVCLQKTNISGKFCYSPLSLDIDSNGVTTKDDVIKYDIDGDGNTNVINDSADAVLCFDRDKDGICGKDGSELFGDNTRFGFEDKDFKGYPDGFDALRALAEHEGLISANDTILDENDIKYLENKWGLRIKKGGYLSQGEKLTDNKITQISTSSGEKHWYENFDDKGNSLMVQDGASFVIDNKTNIFADIWHTIVDFFTGLFK